MLFRSIISVVGIISVVIRGHFGGGDHFDGGDHFGGGTVLASEVIWSEYTRIISVLSGAK